MNQKSARLVVVGVLLDVWFVEDLDHQLSFASDRLLRAFRVLSESRAYVRIAWWGSRAISVRKLRLRYPDLLLVRIRPRISSTRDSRWLTLICVMCAMWEFVKQKNKKKVIQMGSKPTVQCQYRQASNSPQQRKTHLLRDSYPNRRKQRSTEREGMLPPSPSSQQTSTTVLHQWGNRLFLSVAALRVKDKDVTWPGPASHQKAEPYY